MSTENEEDKRQQGDRQLAGSYVDYIKSRRKELTHTVTGAFTRLGLLIPPPPMQGGTPEPSTATSVGSSTLDEIRRQRQQAKGGAQAITLYGKVIEQSNAGAVGSRIQRLRSQTQVTEEEVTGFVASAIALAAAPNVQVDARGAATAINYPDGKVRKFQYDATGELVAVTEKDGSAWKKIDASTWEVTEVNGKTKKLKAEVSVDEIGTYVCAEDETGNVTTETADGTTLRELADGYKITQFADGSRVVLCPDGTRMQLLADGTMVTETDGGLVQQRADGVLVETDLDRRITRIERGDKNVREFRYLSTGELYEFSDFDGTVWHRVPSGSWVSYDANLLDSGFEFKTNIFVDETGAMTFEESNGAAKLFVKPDGSASFEGKDGITKSDSKSASILALLQQHFVPVETGAKKSAPTVTPTPVAQFSQPAVKSFVSKGDTVELSFDGRGRVKRVAYGDGTAKEIEWDDKDNVIATKDETGKRTVKNADQSWTTYNTHGEAQENSPPYKLYVDNDGTITMKYPDGMHTVMRTDGSALRQDDDGFLKQFMSRRKRRFTVNSAGVWEYKIRNNDQLDEIACDAAALQEWSRIHFDPPATSVETTKTVIIALNKITDQHHLRTGDLLKIPI